MAASDVDACAGQVAYDRGLALDAGSAPLGDDAEHGSLGSMTRRTTEVMTHADGVAISPVPIIAIVPMLSTARAPENASAFVVGAGGVAGA
jgi:hypothetical protein